jgi:RNA polymerase sigma factor (sigma-70 family)
MPEPRENQIEFYEGMVRKTAALNMSYWQDDYEDLCQFFRIKVWRALETFDPEKFSSKPDRNGRTPIERYVFMCVTNGVKDVRKRVRRDEVSIEEKVMVRSQRGQEDFRGQAFEYQYLSSEDTWEALQKHLAGPDPNPLPELPSTLSAQEKEIVRLLYLDRSRAEIAERLEMTRPELNSTISGIRAKMADWRPTVKDKPPEGAKAPRPKGAAAAKVKPPKGPSKEVLN